MEMLHIILTKYENAITVCILIYGVVNCIIKSSILSLYLKPNEEFGNHELYRNEKMSI